MNQLLLFGALFEGGAATSTNTNRTKVIPSASTATAAGTVAAAAVATTEQQPAGTPETATSAADDTAVQVLDERTAPEKLRDISTLILDCDGVLWRGNDIIRNAPEALRAFRCEGKRLLFVTNNSSKSRAEYAARFRGLGLEVAPEEIVSSSYCAAAYLTSIGFGAGNSHQGNNVNKNTNNKKVLLLGWSGVEQELQTAGIPFLGGREFSVPLMDNMEAMKELKVDPDIGAVVVGWDPHFSYSRLVYASICLRELPGCLLVATNTDCADHIGGGRMMPGTGGLVRAVEVAAGMKAVNVAKGGEWLLPYLCRTYGLEPSRTAIIGDRLDTDIFLGRQGGLFTCLPLTGVTTLERLRRLAVSERPDVVIGSVAQLAGLP
ncbi:hypothetical protein VOLCADRAFT_115779 [Volvox carteri f. nagariensis]|uniref:Phosphoglycolate phosphatase n=1 Tax=Volvox carteri f. nagariensis TaxID=3068 RepID=D8TI70_VOLCA|nr:uncharacterized protein VOLCADRAFT_115779 [Volvox carteri f. nagariensis]EFJ53185.1 hypothetical protein VOLCADRAFT_115779 [Volvox carteri f. nagariensis]|eukprot:XP_002946190.1 hypothetical protein VOLCADRAFT_115779 [Volvox carteri f. nagariensis]